MLAFIAAEKLKVNQRKCLRLLDSTRGMYLFVEAQGEWASTPLRYEAGHRILSTCSGCPLGYTVNVGRGVGFR
jgi:hypothetical protein